MRFGHDQATDDVNFSLLHPSGRYGHPVAPGEPQRFETSLAKLYLGKSAVLGPPGPTVTLSLRLSMKPRAAGRVLRVEVFATDDAGHQQGFDQVGTVAVQR